MAENRSPFVRPGETLDYQPVAVPAVLAAVTATAALLATVALVAHGLTSGRVAVYPLVLLIGAAGLFLASVARASIRRSEGTRAGMGMASAAWWASLLSLICYGAYAFGSEAAIRSQSVREGQAFFDALASSPNRAFFLTVEPVRRANIPPEDEEQLEAEFGPSGQFGGFKNAELVRLYRRNAGKVTAKFLGVKNWEQTPTGYAVIQNWEVATPEGGFTVELPLFATEGKEVAGRQWHVVLPNERNFVKPYRTRYGVAVMSLIREADAQAKAFCAVARDDKGRAYELTLPPSIRMARQAIASTAGLMLPAAKVPDDFAATFLKTAGGEPSRKGDEFRTIWERGTLAEPSANGPFAGTSIPDLTIGSDKVEARVAIEATVDPRLPNGKMYRGQLVLEVTGPELAAKLEELRAEANAAPHTPAGDAEVVKELPPHFWRVTGFESNLAPQSLAEKSGPPGAPRR